MYLPLALALMTAIALILVTAPLMRTLHRAPERPEFDRAVYRDQLKELERDRARGLIGEAEAASARIEIERRMLAADRETNGTAANTPAAPRLAAVLALVLACCAGGLYLALGAPGVPDEPAASRVASKMPDTSIAALVTRVADNPKDGEGWALLGQAEAQANDWDKAVDAYRHATTLAPENADLAAAYGEALVLQASGVVTPASADAFRGALAHDPANGVARYYLALGDAQAGRTDQAIAAWQKLAAEAPANSPVRQAVERRIDDAAKQAGIAPPPLAPPAAPAAGGASPPGPDAAQMAAAANMTPEDRQKMIHGMVDKLAAELQAKPDDLQGWMRLARAYGVLGERDKAADAYDRAAALDPKNVQIPLNEVDMLLSGDAVPQPMPDRVLALLKKAQALSPDEPEVLWYLGLNAAQQRKPDEAAGYWRRLLAALPASAPERATVSQALGSLKTP